MKKMRLLIDTDNGLGGPLNLFPPKGTAFDVDDGLAVVLAVQSKKLEVEGITTVHGVSNPKDSRIVTNKLLKLLKREDIPVIEGAYNKKQFGEKTKASNFLVKKILEANGDMSICTLGPLTNLATAFKQEPKILNKIEKFAIMGGFLPRNDLMSWLYPTEFNFNLDIDAAEYVIKKLQESGIPTIVTDMNVCMQCQFSDRQISILKSVKNPLTEFILNGVKYFYYFNKGVNPISKGFYPWDPISIASLIDESIFETRFFWSDLSYIKLGGFLKMGGLFKILKKKPDGYKRPLEYCINMDGERFLTLLMKALIGKKV